MAQSFLYYAEVQGINGVIHPGNPLFLEKIVQSKKSNKNSKIDFSNLSATALSTEIEHIKLNSLQSYNCATNKSEVCMNVSNLQSTLLVHIIPYTNSFFVQKLCMLCKVSSLICTRIMFKPLKCCSFKQVQES